MIAALLAVAVAAFCVRVYRTDATFHSGDFASIPYMVTHLYAPVWIPAHIHGPLLPAVVWGFARLCVAAGLGMTEMLWRLPLVLVGSAQIFVTFLLMRRLGAMRWTALLAAGMAAVLPSLVTDARYPWGYETLAVFMATAAIWAWLRALDLGTLRSECLAGGLIGLYLLSHLVIHALPLMILAAALIACGPRPAMRRLTRWPIVAPVLIAAAFTLFSYFALGGGILSRIGQHVGTGTLNAGGGSWATLPVAWLGHVGPIWLVICVAGIAGGLILISGRDRRGLPALWAVAYVAPMWLLIDLERIGRTTTYQIQGTYAATLAGCILLELIWKTATARTGRWLPVVRAGIVTCGGVAITAQALGAVSNQYLTHRFPSVTGTIDYGRVIPDPGFKAAGWYVRRHVAEGAVILATHGMMGLEYPNAVYYLGRHVVAGENIVFETQCRIIQAVRDDIDVAVVEPRFLPLFTDGGAFEIRGRITRNDEPVLFVAARAGSHLPKLGIDVQAGNAAFDQAFAPRRLAALIAPNPGVSALRDTIDAIVRGEPIPPPIVLDSGALAASH